MDVKCHNCGGSLDELLARTCPTCGLAIVEEQHGPPVQHGQLFLSGVKIMSAQVAGQGGGFEALARTSASCGATAEIPEATTCLHCGAKLRSAADSMWQAAGGASSRPPSSPEEIANWRRSVENLASHGLRDATLAAEAQLLAGCPSCQGGLAVMERKVMVGRRRSIFKFRRRQVAERSRPQPMHTVASPTYVLICLRCGFTRDLHAASP